VKPVERLEDMRLLVLGDAGARIRDGNPQAFAFHSEAVDGHLP